MRWLRRATSRRHSSATIARAWCLAPTPSCSTRWPRPSTSCCGRSKRRCAIGCSCISSSFRRSRPSATPMPGSPRRSRTPSSGSSCSIAARAERRVAHRSATMRLIDPSGAWRRRLLAAPLVLALGGAGCSTLRTTLHGYDLGPNGIARPQHRLREAVATGDFVRALAWHEEDDLLDRLNRATAAYYAGQFLRAGAMLDTAALVSDDRITERLSRDALALVTNDNARQYRPRRTERLFIPYYGMQAYARAGNWSDAAVEARRLAALLAQHDGDRDERERPLHATLEHLAGAVFERAGYRDEAQVAYRAANRMLDQAPERIPGPGHDEGELLLVLERGFVAHRVTERIDIYVGDDETRRRERDPRRDEDATSGGVMAPADPGRTTNASSVLAPVGAPASDSARPRRRRRDRERDDDDYWIAVAFPMLRHSTRPWGTARSEE